jgi:hypothetical protein
MANEQPPREGPITAIVSTTPPDQEMQAIRPEPPPDPASRAPFQKKDNRDIER